MANVARNWNMDGWTALDWQTVEVYSRALLKAGNDLDDGVGGGGGGFTPDDLLDAADNLTAIANRLRELAKSYV